VETRRAHVRCVLSKPDRPGRPRGLWPASASGSHRGSFRSLKERARRRETSPCAAHHFAWGKMKSRILIAACLQLMAALIAACASSKPPTCDTGKEGCACYPNHTCDQDLSCESSLCVRLNDGTLALAPTNNSVVEGRSGAGGGISSKSNSQMSAGGSASKMSSEGSAGSRAREADAGPPGDSGDRPRPSESIDAGRADNAPAESQAGDTPDAGRAPVNCTPRCGDSECGPDPICQTSCGECAANLECIDGTCHASVPLRKNGETCAGNSDCASSNCGRSRTGESLCYGILGPNDPCSDTFDCNSGICLAKILDRPETVCVDGLQACDDLGILDTCTASLAVATCQLNQLCDTPSMGLDFNSCIRFGCTYWNDNPPSGGCEGQLSFARGGQANCPR
jgi:hypothetical protein